MSLVDHVFAGSSEMAGRMRSANWEETALGPIETWPQSLRTAVSICLGSRHPIVLWWGPERFMFYNDAYRPMLGESKHPQFLGRPGHECWSEIWTIIGPMMDEVIQTGEATWSEDFALLMQRFGYLEETYFTFSYSPIRDDAGRVNGIFNACTESTARVLADRRMKVLRQMVTDARTVRDAARSCANVLARNARDVPFALVYLEGEDGALTLAAHANLEPETKASPSIADDAWPFAGVVEDGHPILVSDLASRFDCLPKEPWDEAANAAMLMPIADGVLVLGISPRRAFDDDYRGFFDVLAGHVSTMIANARAHEEERERSEKLAELDRAKTAFFSNVSHEFRTPLTLMLGPIEDALRKDASVGGADLTAVHRACLRLLRLVNNLLDFARVEASRVQARYVPTDLALLTSGLAGAFQSLVESAGLKLNVNCAPLPDDVWVDRGQWEKIVLNLISNAFKFTMKGEITISLHATDSHVELEVMDTGTGIPASELPKIFDRFHRVEGAKGRSFEGSGIGLALVRELAVQHGGSVEVRSVVGEGSTFIVTIPRGKDHLPQDLVASVEKTSGPPNVAATSFLLEAAHWRPEPVSALQPAPAAEARILIADDNADMREYLTRLLSTRWLVEAVGDGKQALDAALERPPDLVLSDVMMPSLDGIGLLRALRENATTSTVPVILLSARAGEDAVSSGLDTGADDYLVKPFATRELMSRVATHIELSRLRRAALHAATELAQTRAELLEDLDRKNKELEVFAYSVSHDLRAPLRTIDGFSQALMEDNGPVLDAQGREHLERVRAAAQRMGQLIDDLLHLSRIERSEMRRRTLDLSDIARRVGDTLKNAHPDHPVSLSVAEGLVVDGDERLIQILLENVLGNAWKFTRSTSTPRVHVASRLEKGDRVFFVQDNGAGFDNAYVERLFTPFQRLHTQNEFPGTGVGLATVKRIVERHGGRVWAEGSVGAGATVSFTLSATRAPSGQARWAGRSAVSG